MKGASYRDYSSETIQRSATPIEYVDYDIKDCNGRLGFTITLNCRCGSYTTFDSIGYGNPIKCPECKRNYIFTWKPIVKMICMSKGDGE